MKNIISEKVLIAVYVVMIIICIVLNVTSNQGYDTGSIIINIAMFIIVGLIFVWAVTKPLKKTSRLSRELKAATEKIKQDFTNSNSLLWEQYKKDESSGLFKEGELSAIFHEYLYEMKRLEAASSVGYRCSIEDYFNHEMIDAYAKKNLLNLIPGAMTGLGILGTFIGLSLGLHSFNTGTSAEIEESIAPLMNGIKIAFHTSIYGLVFSLFFNLVYKTLLEEAYNDLDDFLEAYTRYVYPDDSQQWQSNAIINPLLTAVQTMNNNLIAVLVLQKEQFEEFKMLPERMKEMISESIDEIVTPQLAKTNENLEHFTNKVGEMQLNGMGDLVDNFMYQMNQSLDGSFSDLSKIIEETCDLQKQNNDHMQGIMSSIGTMTEDTKKINELSADIITSLAEYIQEVENLQSAINQSFMSVNIQLEKNHKMEEIQQSYIATLVDYEKKIGDASEKFSRDMASQVEMLGKLELEVSEGTRKNLELLSAKATEYSQSIADTAKQQIQSILTLASSTTSDMDRAAQELGRVSGQLSGQLQQSLQTTFDIFDQELSDITKHLSGTIAEVDSTTERVPKVVAAAYDDMGKSFEEMQKQMQAMIHMLDIMQRNMPDIAKKLAADN